jgi:Prokaryotic homologs of the JAB domain
MTTATLDRLKTQLTAARARGDLPEITRLYFQLPLSERTQPITAAGRGYALPRASVVGLARPAARDSLTRAPAAQLSGSVLIDDGAWRVLDGDQFDGAERGGYLYGPVDSPHEITYAVVADLDEDRTGRSVLLDREAGHRIWESMPLDITIRGSWHVHPHGSNAQPSPTDLRSAQGTAKAYDRPWIEIVVHDAPTHAIGIDGRARQTSTFEISATIVQPDGSYTPAQVTRSF